MPPELLYDSRSAAAAAAVAGAGAARNVTQRDARCDLNRGFKWTFIGLAITVALFVTQSALDELGLGPHPDDHRHRLPALRLGADARPAFQPRRLLESAAGRNSPFNMISLYLGPLLCRWKMLTLSRASWSRATSTPLENL